MTMVMTDRVDRPALPAAGLPRTEVRDGLPQCSEHADGSRAMQGFQDPSDPASLRNQLHTADFMRMLRES